MAVALGAGRVGYQPNVPPLEDGQTEPCRVRPATAADLPFVARVYDEAARQRYLLACVRDKAMWRHELQGHSLSSVARREIRVVEAAATGYLVAFQVHDAELSESGKLWVMCYEVAPGHSWLAVTPSVLRYLRSTGVDYAAR